MAVLDDAQAHVDHTADPHRVDRDDQPALRRVRRAHQVDLVAGGQHGLAVRRFDAALVDDAGCDQQHVATGGAAEFGAGLDADGRVQMCRQAVGARAAEDGAAVGDVAQALVEHRVGDVQRGGDELAGVDTRAAAEVDAVGIEQDDFAVGGQLAQDHRRVGAPDAVQRRDVFGRVLVLREMHLVAGADVEAVPVDDHTFDGALVESCRCCPARSSPRGRRRPGRPSRCPWRGRRRSGVRRCCWPPAGCRPAWPVPAACWRRPPVAVSAPAAAAPPALAASSTAVPARRSPPPALPLAREVSATAISMPWRRLKTRRCRCWFIAVRCSWWRGGSEGLAQAEVPALAACAVAQHMGPGTARPAGRRPTSSRRPRPVLASWAVTVSDGSAYRRRSTAWS